MQNTKCRAVTDSRTPSLFPGGNPCDVDEVDDATGVVGQSLFEKVKKKLRQASVFASSVDRQEYQQLVSSSASSLKAPKQKTRHSWHHETQ